MLLSLHSKHTFFKLSFSFVAVKAFEFMKPPPKFISSPSNNIVIRTSRKTFGANPRFQVLAILHAHLYYSSYQHTIKKDLVYISLVDHVEFIFHMR